jgi:hypothetical protein
MRPLVVGTVVRMRVVLMGKERVKEIQSSQEGGIKQD